MSHLTLPHFFITILSHGHTFKPPHCHDCTVFYLKIGHCHTLIVQNCHTFTIPHCHTCKLSRSCTLTLSHALTFTLQHSNIFTLSHSQIIKLSYCETSFGHFTARPHWPIHKHCPIYKYHKLSSWIPPNLQRREVIMASLTTPGEYVQTPLASSTSATRKTIAYRYISHPTTPKSPTPPPP